MVVKGYYCLPGAGLTWPTDFVQMTPLVGIPIASIGANNTEEVTVGPFEWIPNANVYGHVADLIPTFSEGGRKDGVAAPGREDFPDQGG